MAVQSAPRPRLRRANFHSESPACTRIVLPSTVATGCRGAGSGWGGFRVATGAAGFAGITARGAAGRGAGKILEGIAEVVARREPVGTKGRTGRISLSRDFGAATGESRAGREGCCRATGKFGAAGRGEIFSAGEELESAAWGTVRRSCDPPRKGTRGRVGSGVNGSRRKTLA